MADATLYTLYTLQDLRQWGASNVKEGPAEMEALRLRFLLDFQHVSLRFQLQSGADVAFAVTCVHRFLRAIQMSTHRFRIQTQRLFCLVRRLQRWVRRMRWVAVAKLALMLQFWISTEDTHKRQLRAKIKKFKAAHPTSTLCENPLNSPLTKYTRTIPLEVKQQAVRRVYRNAQKRFSADFVRWMAAREAFNAQVQMELRRLIALQRPHNRVSKRELRKRALANVSKRAEIPPAPVFEFRTSSISLEVLEAAANEILIEREETHRPPTPVDPLVCRIQHERLQIEESLRSEVVWFIERGDSHSDEDEADALSHDCKSAPKPSATVVPSGTVVRHAAGTTMLQMRRTPSSKQKNPPASACSGGIIWTQGNAPADGFVPCNSVPQDYPVTWTPLMKQNPSRYESHPSEVKVELRRATPSTVTQLHVSRLRRRHT